MPRTEARVATAGIPHCSTSTASAVTPVWDRLVSAMQRQEAMKAPESATSPANTTWERAAPNPGGAPAATIEMSSGTSGATESRNQRSP